MLNKMNFISLHFLNFGTVIGFFERIIPYTFWKYQNLYHFSEIPNIYHEDTPLPPTRSQIIHIDTPRSRKEFAIIHKEENIIISMHLSFKNFNGNDKTNFNHNFF